MPLHSIVPPCYVLVIRLWHTKLKHDAGWNYTADNNGVIHLNLNVMLQRNQRKVSTHGIILLLLMLLNGIILMYGFTINPQLYWWLTVSVPLLLVTIYKMQQKKQTDHSMPGTSPYFFEQAPGEERQHIIVYQSATNTKHIFGIHINDSKTGYKWADHSAYPQCIEEEEDLRITIGNHQCRQPYNASILNIGASYSGTLSNVAIQALNEGAMLGGFARNTGEDEISQHYLNGGNLIWQIGPQYLGCRNEKGNFNTGKFMENATRPEIKMIELKLVQAAKSWNVPATTHITQLAAGSIISRLHHTAFSNAESMLMFIDTLREMSFGKPVGLRICIENKKQVYELCYCIQKTGIIPDFITVDGVEGEMRAVLSESENKAGMPLYEALTFVSGTLQAYGLRQHIKIIAAGEIISGFDVVKALALGADACCSSGAMIFASRFKQIVSDSGNFPVSATARQTHYKIPEATDTATRVANFHKNTIQAAKALMVRCGFKKIKDITVPGFFRLINIPEIQSVSQLYAPKKVKETRKIAFK